MIKSFAGQYLKVGFVTFHSILFFYLIHKIATSTSNAFIFEFSIYIITQIHSFLNHFRLTKEQQEKIALREQRQREEDLKQLDRLIRKYSDNIVIKVDHYISGNLDSGVIGHRRDYADYEDIEEISRDDKGNIELAICVCD